MEKKKGTDWERERETERERDRDGELDGSSKCIGDQTILNDTVERISQENYLFLSLCGKS